MKKAALLFIYFCCILFDTFSQNNQNLSPYSDLPKLDIVEPVDANSLLGKEDEYTKKISGGKSAHDLINEINTIQNVGQKQLNQYNNNDFDGGKKVLQEGYQKLKEQLNPQYPSLQSTNQPMDLSRSTATSNSPTPELKEIDISRYTNSPCFQTLGYDSNNPNLEASYQECEESVRDEKITKNLKLTLKAFLYFFVSIFILYRIKKLFTIKYGGRRK